VPAVVAEDVHALAEVVVGVLVVADPDAADARADADRPLAILEPLGAQGILVFAGVEQAGDGCGGDRRPLRFRAVAVVNGPGRAGAVGQVFVGILDDLLRHRDTGVAGGTETLDLRDGHRTFVVVAAFELGGVVPAAAARLRRG